MLPSTTHSSSALELYVGLGGAATADLLHLTWPDGTTADLSDIGAGQTIEWEY